MPARRILIADDEQYPTHILAHNVRRAGYEVSTADDGQQAYDAACKEAPDLIITDYQMPTLDGFEMCRKLRSNPATAQVPILMLTARGHRIPAEDLLQTSIRCMMPKPFSARQLIAKVQELLGDPAELPAQAPISNSVPAIGRETGH